MLPDRVSNPGPLTYESGALPSALRGPAGPLGKKNCSNGLGHMTNMAVMPIYAKNLKKSSPEPIDQ